MLLTTIPMSHPVFATSRWHDARWQHHKVMSLFGDLGNSPDARARGQILFRVEPDVTTPGHSHGRVLVQSNVAPVVDGLRTTPLDAVLDRYQPGQQAQFLLTANTVRTINRTNPDGHTRTHRARIPDSQLDGWIKDRIGHAITIDQLTATPAVRRQGRAQLILTTFRGTGTVTDPAQLRRLCIDGIGRAKAYGCGLLTALPMQ